VRGTDPGGQSCSRRRVRKRRPLQIGKWQGFDPKRLRTANPARDPALPLAHMRTPTLQLCTSIAARFRRMSGSSDREEVAGTTRVVGSGVVFYVILFSAMAVLLVVGGLTVVSRNRRQLEADKRHETATAHEHRGQRNAKRAQSRKARRKRD
jgi:hypothetical protein